MFEIGKEYNRREEIHGIYGGQSQSGISTPKKHPIIFIFTSASGEQHGYRDEYREDGIFWYTGEGQVGDMRMVSGNKAILEHTKNGKAIYVFEYTRPAYVRYVGAADCIGHHEERRLDRNGDERKVFVFHLFIDASGKSNVVASPTPTYGSKNVKDLKNRSVNELRNATLNTESQRSNSKEKREMAFYRSEAIKLYVFARSKGQCEGCGSDAPFRSKTGPFLECHHVHRLADGGPDHPENVVALCPNCHRRAHYALDAKKYNDELKLVAIKADSKVVEALGH